MPFIDILIFAVIAIFLIFRLRSILGTKDGFEKSENRMHAESSTDNVINFKGKSSDTGTAPISGSGLKELRKLDPNFNDEEFSKGAKAVFPLILSAFADGDLGNLRRFLGFDLYEEFSSAIHQRESIGEKLKINIEKIDDIQLLDAEVSDGIASITVKFSSVQTRTLTDANDIEVEDDSMSSESIEDICICERDIRSKDPNWKLVETGTTEEE